MKKYEKPQITDVIKLTNLMAVTVASTPTQVADKGPIQKYEDTDQLAKGGMGSVWDK